MSISLLRVEVLEVAQQQFTFLMVKFPQGLAGLFLVISRPLGFCKIPEEWKYFTTDSYIGGNCHEEERLLSLATTIWNSFEP